MSDGLRTPVKVMSVDEMADRIKELEDINEALYNAQHYTFIGKDGKPRLARDMEEEIEALEAKLAKAEEFLNLIAIYRKMAHDYDTICGRAWRRFDIEDVKTIESAARTFLAELTGEKND